MLFKPPHKIIATILVKNEADIIAQTIEHHINQGIENFIITDNDSTDQTKNIISKYPEVKEIIEEPEDTHHQSKWVTRMARLACKFNPDWIVHLDADELWCGFANLKNATHKIISSETVYIHPPVKIFNLYNMRFYLSFDRVPIPQECKIIHRPDPNITIAHGNHSVDGKTSFPNKQIIRHHYPIRSIEQWKRKSNGHKHLQKRNAICDRWEMWYQMGDELKSKFEEITEAWQRLIITKNQEDLNKILEIWSTQEMIESFKKNQWFPDISQWMPFDVPSVC
jgi:glycosyltransferase involved in cell wall biosynthesis